MKLPRVKGDAGVCALYGDLPPPKHVKYINRLDDGSFLETNINSVSEFLDIWVAYVLKNSTAVVTFEERGEPIVAEIGEHYSRMIERPS